MDIWRHMIYIYFDTIYLHAQTYIWLHIFINIYIPMHMHTPPTHVSVHAYLTYWFFKVSGSLHRLRLSQKSAGDGHMANMASMLDITAEEADSLAVVDLFVDMVRPLKGRAATTSLKKTSFIRAEWRKQSVLLFLNDVWFCVINSWLRSCRNIDTIRSKASSVGSH